MRWLEPLVVLSDLPASTAYLIQRAHTQLGNDEAASQWRERTARIRERERLTSVVNQVLHESPQSFWGQVILAHQFASRGNWAEAEAILAPLEQDPPPDAFFHDLISAVRSRRPLPPLERLPIKEL
jgi:hypothetical protein